LPLVEITLPTHSSILPEDVAALLREADLRIDQFLRNRPAGARGFVPSQFATVYHALRAIVDGNLAPGNLFCEWGSGFGVVASLAAMLEFDAYGIEIESELVEASRQLAEHFDLPVTFVHGSLIPRGSEDRAEAAAVANCSSFFWLVTDADDAYDELGFASKDVDVVFAYPWPGEECLFESLFENNAADGALLLTYNEFDSVRLQRNLPSRQRSA
jgi:hypothetical protein